MRTAGIAGVHRRRCRGCTRRDLDATPFDDLVNRAFNPTSPDRLWCMDVTGHPTGEGKVYLAVVLDAFSRRIVGWSIAEHMRAELVVDALQMALWRRQPPASQTIAHSDHGSVGGCERWAQHLECGGVGWESPSSRGRRGRCGGRFTRPAGRRCGSASRFSASG